MENTSPKLKLNWVDLYKIGRGALIIAAAAVIDYLGKAYLQFDYTISFACTAEMVCKTIDFSMLAIPVISSLLEGARRLLTDYSR